MHPVILSSPGLGTRIPANAAVTVMVVHSSAYGTKPWSYRLQSESVLVRTILRAHRDAQHSTAKHAMSVKQF